MDFEQGVFEIVVSPIGTSGLSSGQSNRFFRYLIGNREETFHRPKTTVAVTRDIDLLERLDAPHGHVAGIHEENATPHC